jgi:heat shock protein HslJ
MKILFSLFALIMITESCNSAKETIENTAKKISSLSGAYSISEIGNHNSIYEELSITFEDSTNKVYGFAGCNTFFGTYTLDNSSITFNNIASSKKLCEKDLNTLESHFLKALNKVNSFSINDNTISFLENKATLFVGNKTMQADKSDAVKNKDHITFTYQALSRGFFEYIQISPSEVIISKDRNLIDTNTYNCDENDWNALIVLLKNVNLEIFQDLVAPTGKRFYDGAPYATLAIKQGVKDVKTPSFDHGSPPKAIHALVNKVLSIKENAIKQ